MYTELAQCDDVTLLLRARGADRVAFGELVRRHQGSALRVAAVIAGSTSEAEDIVQDSFVDVHRNLGSYRGSGTVRSWMLRIVANHAKNHVRSRVRRLRRDDRHARLHLRTTEGADQAAERQLEHEALATALGRLPERDREVLACRFVAGLTEAETAEVLGAALGTVKSRTSRALARLHEQLASHRADGGSKMIGTPEMDDLSSRLIAFGDALAFDDARWSIRCCDASRQRGRGPSIDAGWPWRRSSSRLRWPVSRSIPTAGTPWRVGWVSRA